MSTIPANSNLIPIDIAINYSTECDKICNFLEKFVEESSGSEKYIPKLQQISNRELDHLVIELDDVAKFDDSPFGLAEAITQNTKTYIDVFSYVIDHILPEPTIMDFEDDTPIDVILKQRQQANRQREGENQEEQADSGVPPTLTRRYTLSFKPLSHKPLLAVRDLKAKYVGKLVTVTGIVTRVSDVKPLVIVNAYTCDRCGCEVFEEVKGKQFTPIVQCPSEDCKINNTKGQLNIQTRASKFIKYQELKLQEMADQVPVGHTPRTLTVHLYESLTRQLNPGDIVNLSGIFLPTPFTGFKAIRAGLLADTYLHSQYIHHIKKSYEQMETDEETQSVIEALKNDGDAYSKLAKSIAPEIYGLEDVKKALLLLLVGGGTKVTEDGMKIRGDINVCLMGDPGMAKSQLLKFISKVAPRAVYTTGRGSSGVGLTAAVMRDTVTDELVLEGGALVLSDNGICCIDEFDKMDESDRTAIHEVMEQQTISISKAGINTTLNARTSILAAANPAYGRYHVGRSPSENINLPAALLSRFDILFLILDLPSDEEDRLLAQHVTHVHMHNAPPAITEQGILTPAQLSHYIAQARKIETTITPEVEDYIVSSYVELRKIQANSQGVKNKDDGAYVSARSLLAIIRLSQACARIRFSETVEAQDVNEALRLIDSSKASLENSRGRHSEQVSDTTAHTGIYRTIRDLRKQTDGNELWDLSIDLVRQRVLASGYKEAELEACIEKYQGLGIWALNQRRTTLTFLNVNRS